MISINITKRDIMNINKYLLTEVKTKITPLLGSIFKRIDDITKDEAEMFVSKLNSDGNTSYQVSYGLPMGKGRPQIIIKQKDSEFDSAIKTVTKVITSSGWKVVSSKAGDGNTWVINMVRN